MDISQESDPESHDEVPVLSSYAKNLESHVRERYLKKISVVGVDLAAIPSEQFSSECLPPIEVSDLLSYLVLEKSYYTNKQFKAFKSLEAYNQMVSGLVASAVQGKEIAGKTCCCGQGETFLENERSSCQHLDHCRKERNHHLCALLRLQGRTG